MNPFSILINYVIANSRASFYNVSGNQEITNTALLAGAVSENPLLNYLIIENKAKIEGDKFIADKATDPGRNTTSGTASTTTATTTTENDPKATQSEGNATANVVTLETLQAKISESTANLESQIAKISENNSKVEKIIAETLLPRIEILEKNNADINVAIQEIKNRLDVIAKALPASEASAVVDQKPPVKNVKR
ncbi:hypothetical protein ACQ9BO_15735 [Flavobacterium sp. P21]|uniref:hypothetical protein n=1 Tax=Flavobacterium sp. P21 TaxID=3423948 RepID=UPI003D666479